MGRKAFSQFWWLKGLYLGWGLRQPGIFLFAITWYFYITCITHVMVLWHWYNHLNSMVQNWGPQLKVTTEKVGPQKVTSQAPVPPPERRPRPCCAWLRRPKDTSWDGSCSQNGWDLSKSKDVNNKKHGKLEHGKRIYRMIFVIHVFSIYIIYSPWW